MKQPLSLLERYRLASTRLQQLWDEQAAHPSASPTALELVAFGVCSLCTGFSIASASVGFGLLGYWALVQLGLLA